MASFDIVKFIQAVWPCLQQNYGSLFSGISQIIGGASMLAAAFRATNLGSAGGGLFSGLFSLLNKVGLNPPAAPPAA